LEILSQQAAKLQALAVSTERVVELLDEQPDVTDRPNAVPLYRAWGDFELVDVSFGYPNEPDVLRGVNVRIPAGSRVGLVGRTGAGKSTLISLLIRFYDVRTGVIRLDGRDLRNYRLDDLRSQFAMVLQEPFLFATTIADNIAYARGATEDEIVAAAVAAGVHDFIAGLPDGYETVVGERGMRLSGGERQRISLARAFLKDAPILLLDEPTSSVDVATEQEIMDAMVRLMEGRTTFMIAHRFATLSVCDMVLELADGEVRTLREPALVDRT
jgi:ATP-binding cassette subfamily B protein